MSKLCKFTFRLAAASLIALVPASPSLADPTLNDVPAHRHFLETPKGDWVPIGPDICSDPDLQDAFNQFHHNVHVSSGSTLGPQGGAPGLDDGRGGDIRAMGGCPDE
jgi:hypothetical protein